MFAYLLLIVTIASAYNSMQWAGIDNPVTISPPLAQPLPDSIDTQSTLYPSVIAFGSVYVPYGSIVLAYGDIVINNQLSILQHIAYTNAIAARLCSIPPCSTNMYINISSCSCICMPGFTGILCDKRICANNGSWVGSACVCPQPYTPASLCTEYACPTNALFDPATRTCECVAGYSGSSCTTALQLPQQQPPRCIDPYAGTCRQKKNWGVAQCTLGICSCFPLYDIVSNSFVQRWVPCGASLQCQQWFHTIAPYCCMGTVACERLQHSITYCATEACCDGLRGEQCIARGCSITAANACILSLPQWQVDPSVTFYKKSISCWASPVHPLCNSAAATSQTIIRRTPDAYTQIQLLAHVDISQFDIWDDSIPHSIVLYAPTSDNPGIIACETSWRLSFNSDAAAWSMFTWSCGNTIAAQTSYTFKLVQGSLQNIDPAIIGSVYTIWLYNSQTCLLDRTLQTDELVYFGITTPYQNDLVAINIADQSNTASESDCGIFIVQDNSIYTLYTALSIAQNPDDASRPTLSPLPQSQLQYTITTPPTYRDSDSIPQPITDDLSACRHLPCRIPTVRASCASTACAINTLNISSACVPCIRAHIILT